MKRAWIHVATCLLLLCGGSRAESAPYSTPPDDVVEHIRREYLREWIRVTTPTSRYELKADDIGRDGMAGLSSRRADEAVPQRIAWAAIERIDVQHSHTLLGAGVGALAGGFTLAILPALYSSSDPGGAQNYFYAGAIAGGLLGAWIGHSHKREDIVYLAQPGIDRPEAVHAAVQDSTAANAWLGTAADSGSVAVSSTVDPLHAVTPAPSTPEIERACRALSSDDLLRIDGGFGRFVGYAFTIAPSGLDGLRTEPSMHSTWSQRSLGWEHVDQLDVQRNGAMRGAGRGALITTAIAAAATGVAIALEGGLSSAEGPYLYQFVAYFGLWAIPVGTVLGATIGAVSPYWQHVYRRP